MSDDLVKRLRAYEGKGFETTACYNGTRSEAADRIEELEAKLRETALSELSALGQASEAYTAQLDAEARLAEAIEALQLADAAMSGAKMNMSIVERKVKAAIARSKESSRE